MEKGVVWTPFFQYVRSDCGDKSKYSTIRKIIQQVLILLLIDAIISLRINEGGFHDEKNQHLFLLIFLSLFLLLGMQVSVSAAMQSGDYNYTVSITGKYPDQKSTIYRQKNGTYTKQKLITVSGCATPKLVYKNVLYYEKDHMLHDITSGH